MAIANRGKLFVFEGHDGVGKTTITNSVLALLHKNGVKCEYLSFPGREANTLGSLIYKIHHNPEEYNIPKIDNNSLQILHVAAHIDAIENKIKPILSSGVNILLDRYWWSTYVYGIAFNAKKSILKKIIEAEKVAWGTYLPECIFYIARNTESAINNKLISTLANQYELLLTKENDQNNIIKIYNDNLNETISKIFNTVKTRVKIQSVTKIKQQQLLKPYASLEFKNNSFPPSSLNNLLKPTIVYDTYWQFAAKRQEIFFARFNGMPRPWTNDPILAENKFTNAYRAADRVSQYLIKNVIYSKQGDINDTFFRIILFKLFNKIETWELLEKNLGDISYKNFRFEQYDKILTKSIEKNEKIYSAAYIMPTGGRGTQYDRKHRMHLNLLKQMMDDNLPEKIANSASMGPVFELLRSYHGIGDFLAYQYATDINYSELTNFSETQFVIPGPGAREGIRKCFKASGGLSEAEIIKVVMQNSDEEFDRLGISFKTLWGRKLQLIDCQNLFCETDKYSRIMHPEFNGEQGRTRIKQKFAPHPVNIKYWFPPKWGINEQIQQDKSNE